MRGYLPRARLPVWRELPHKHHVVGITHRHRYTANHFTGKPNLYFAANLGIAHRCSKLEMQSVATDEVADFHSRSRRDGNGFLLVAYAIPCSHAASAIARDLRFRTIGIDEADSNVCIGRGHDPFDAVGADSIVTIADSPAKCADICRSVFYSDDQKIVAAGGRFHKWNGGCDVRNWRSHCADCSKAEMITPLSRAPCCAAGSHRVHSPIAQMAPFDCPIGRGDKSNTWLDPAP